MTLCTNIMAIDLAAKFSAFVVLNDEGIVLSQGSSWKLSESVFIKDHLVAPFKTHSPPVIMIIEDLPHRLRFDSTVKKVCRIQGRIIDAMWNIGADDKILFIPPATWQRSYEGIWRQSPAIVVAKAKELFDYEPPDLVNGLHYKERQDAKKAMTDYSAAYLIARYMLAEYQKQNTFDIPTTSRYA